MLRRVEAKSSANSADGRTGGGLGWQGEGGSKQARRAGAGTDWQWRSGAGSTRGLRHSGRPVSNPGSFSCILLAFLCPRFFLLYHLCLFPYHLAVPLPTPFPRIPSLPPPLPPLSSSCLWILPPNCSLLFLTSSTLELSQTLSPPWLPGPSSWPVSLHCVP